MVVFTRMRPWRVCCVLSSVCGVHVCFGKRGVELGAIGRLPQRLHVLLVLVDHQHPQLEEEGRCLRLG